MTIRPHVLLLEGEELWRAVEESFTSSGIVADTRRGLLDDPKWLSSLYFYDSKGSQLFEAICATPEYYPARTEEAILRDNIDDILTRAGPHLTLAELGSGSSHKTKVVLQALVARQGNATYIPVDVSAEFLQQVAAKLEATHHGLTVHPLAMQYGEGLSAIGNYPAKRRLVLFLGSSIGNFEPEEQVDLMRRAAANLQPGDAFLLGTDLVKDPATLEAAYNDRDGWTAKFNRNILDHLNRELAGDVDAGRFEHVALWNPRARRIEMHLESTANQRMRFPKAALDVPIKQGERIHTENSYKFSMDGVAKLAKASGFTLEKSWTDANEWFALHLLRR